MSHKSGQSRKIIGKNLSDIVLHLSMKFHKNRSNGARVIASETNRQRIFVQVGCRISAFDVRIGLEITIRERNFLVSRFFYRDETNISRLIRTSVLPFCYFKLSDIYFYCSTYMGVNHNVSCQRLSDQVYHLYLQGIICTHTFICVLPVLIYDCET